MSRCRWLWPAALMQVLACGARSELSTDDTGDRSVVDAGALMQNDVRVEARPDRIVPDCTGVAATCGAAQNQNCCARHRVPPGHSTRRGLTVGVLNLMEVDDYEVTVGRFRQFVSAYPPSLPEEAGDGVGASFGFSWPEVWKAAAYELREELMISLRCSDERETWTDDPEDNEALPITCVDWPHAVAFCAWDGGRLITFREWGYIAVGGDEERPAPWGSAPADCEHANMFIREYGYCSGGDGAALRVGSKSPTGDGRWGQSDLFGNVAEWVAAAPLDGDGEFGWTAMGGNFLSGPKAEQKSGGSSVVGFRCGRDAIGPGD